MRGSGVQITQAAPHFWNIIPNIDPQTPKNLPMFGGYLISEPYSSLIGTIATPIRIKTSFPKTCQVPYFACFLKKARVLLKASSVTALFGPSNLLAHTPFNFFSKRPNFPGFLATRDLGKYGKQSQA